MSSQKPDPALICLREKIFHAHADVLKGRQYLIIYCGSTLDSEQSRTSDVDYIVATEQVDLPTLETLGRVRYRLEDTLGCEVSNTVVALERLVARPINLMELDGKAAQALIAAIAEPWRIQSVIDFELQPFTEAAIREFSQMNFFVIQAVLAKYAARMVPEAYGTEAYRYKLAKLCHIALKMRLQAVPNDGRAQYSYRLLSAAKATPIAPTNAQLSEVTTYVCGLRLKDF